MKFYKSVISMFMICTIVATPVLGQQIMQNNEAVEKQQINTLSYRSEERRVGKEC